MISFTTHTGTPAPLYRPNIDTDQIIPKQFLKRIERTGYGEFLFYDWRFAADGSENADFVLNRPQFRNASILIAGPNFGCGSSREHAPWSLLDHGFRAVIAPSFSDIFYNNCLKNGLLPIVLPDAVVAALAARAENDDKSDLKIDLNSQLVTAPDSTQHSFDIDPFHKTCLLNGLDDIALTLEHTARITAYEENLARNPRYSFIHG